MSTIVFAALAFVAGFVVACLIAPWADVAALRAAGVTSAGYPRVPDPPAPESPVSIEQQDVLIGAALCNNALIPGLDASSFTGVRAQVVMAMQTLVENGIIADAVTVRDVIAKEAAGVAVRGVSRT